MKHPAGWKDVKEGERVWVKWPHPEALTRPEFYGKTVNKPGRVKVATEKRPLIELDSGGAIEVKSLDALLIEDDQDKAAKEAWWRT